MPPTPVVQAFLIADSVIQDRATGKWTVVGIFDQIYAASFPCVHPTVALYVKVADALGRYTVKVEFRDAQDQAVSAFEGIELEVKGRARGGEFGIATHGLPLAKPGVHRFLLHMNGEYVASASLEALKLEGKRPPGPA